MSGEYFPKPNRHPIFLTILLNNLQLYFWEIAISTITLGLYSIYFTTTQFFLVGMVFGGATRTVGMLRALSYFWTHGFLELFTMIIFSALMPYFFIKIGVLIHRKDISLENLKPTFFLLIRLMLLSVGLAVISAILEAYIAPIFVIN